MEDDTTILKFLNDGVTYMYSWRDKRYGLSSPKSIYQKVRLSVIFLNNNKINFVLLLLIYISLEFVGNSTLLVLFWSFNTTDPRTKNWILVTLMANLPVKVWRALVKTVIMHVLASALKRRGSVIDLNDIKGFWEHCTFRLIFIEFCLDCVLCSPLNIAQALIFNDLTMFCTYLLFSFLLNCIFNTMQLLVYEDPSIPLFSAASWCVSVFMSQTYFGSILSTFIFLFSLLPFVIFTPIGMLVQLLATYEIIGFSSPDEVINV